MTTDAAPTTMPLAAADASPEAAPTRTAPGDDPLWYKDAIIYQAHVKSFFDSNNDGIGDFRGLTQKLDYLNGLGVTCLWLLPFFPSPLRDDGYDIADYRNVHPSYGTLDDFKAFVEAAHAREIRILIELVVNHTSDQHPWFQRARHAPPGSPARDFYVWSESDQKFPDTTIIFRDTEKSNWTYDPVAKQYYWHRFFSHQPDLNHNNPAVVDAVIDVMKFWLDLGVDALRLDAVPFLCVREGTTNENLPETHAVLRRIRRELDAAYKNRMLLAEANQWPSDVRAYFGDGDECHMAFHFPLMPRMFMAIRQEDRHAITEIFNQTPDIPDNCQWALFLRNHDELTLEMVTDEERDYMYNAYAADPQMRINLGIRRRLAPLLESSRARFELLNAMLFSLPGTPILYYGDEIGMGDNIYLGDRNGVRTPMQWNGDRNGGFSRADPARLFAPPIMDPVYGYQAVNVEAQDRTPFSLLNWMKRLIAMRKQHRVFGRGSLDFVGCANRKVLAYLRRDDRETVLIVVNLSRTVQPAELHLEAFAGLIPVEMSGPTEFPRIGDRGYFLTLGPHASYWFTFQRESPQIGPRLVDVPDPDAAAQSVPSLLVGSDWQGLLDGPARGVVEKQALRPFMERQRWFAPAAAPPRSAYLFDWLAARAGINPAFLTIVGVDHADGLRDRFFLPLGLTGAQPGERMLQQTPTAVLARVTGARKGALIDGLYDDDLSERILAVIERQETIPTRRGAIRGTLISGSLKRTQAPSAVRVGGDPPKRTTFIDDGYVLKFSRGIEAGPSPDVEIGRVLAAQGFRHAPTLVGVLEYEESGGAPSTLAVVETAVKHQGSGWDVTMDELGRYYERVVARTQRTDRPEVPVSGGVGDPDLAVERDHGGPPPFFAAIEAWYLSSAATLGRRTAELHLALARGGGPAFAPEPLSALALGALVDSMHARADTVLGLLQTRAPALSDATRERAEALLAKRDRIASVFARARSLEHVGAKIRIHGDYHLGQVLRVEEDFVIFNFDGEPGRSFADLRSKQSPLKDVAGMMRSFSYAAYAALSTAVAPAPERLAMLEPWADTWQHWAADAFLMGYRNEFDRSELLPPPDALEPMLSAFGLDQALFELACDLNGRLDCVRIPLAGVLTLLR